MERRRMDGWMDGGFVGRPGKLPLLWGILAKILGESSCLCVLVAEKKLTLPKFT